MKNKIIMFVSLLCMLSFSFAQVTLEPIYSAERFQPSDMFHAGCENNIDVVFDLDDIETAGLNAILEYDSKDISISKIIPQGEKENNLTYVIEDNKIIFSKLKTESFGLDKIVFSISFESNKSLTSTIFSFVTGSYLIDASGVMVDVNDTYEFNFATVPECNPDIVAPSITMVFPSIDDSEYVALDSYFKFNLSDSGKGLNKDSINIFIDDIKYDLSNIEHEWDGDILTVYPDVWLPVGSDFVLQISAQDKQVYGKANKTTQIYNLQTSNDLNLLNDIDPVEFRKLVNKEKYYQGSQEECELLAKSYFAENEENKKIILSINKRLSCGDMSLVKNDVSDPEIVEDVLDESGYSVFAVLGWTLLIILLFIKIFVYLTKPIKN